MKSRFDLVDGRLSRSDFEAAVADPELASIHVSWCAVEDWGPVRDARNLHSFSAINSRFCDLSLLGDMYGLQYLNVSCNNIQNLEEIAHLTQINILVCRYTNINCVHAIRGFTGLRRLDARNTFVTDFSPLNHIKGLEIIKE